MTTWRVSIPKTIRLLSQSDVDWYIEGDNEPPLIQTYITNPIPIFTDPLTLLPGEIDIPFEWPSSGTPVGTPADRQYALSMSIPIYWMFSANIQGAGVPSSAFIWAGIIGNNAFTDYKWNVSEMNLWVLNKADFDDPLTGQRIIPPPGYLIRRALKYGRVTEI